MSQELKLCVIIYLVCKSTDYFYLLCSTSAFPPQAQAQPQPGIPLVPPLPPRRPGHMSVTQQPQPLALTISHLPPPYVAPAALQPPPVTQPQGEDGRHPQIINHPTFQNGAARIPVVPPHPSMFCERTHTHPHDMRRMVSQSGDVPHMLNHLLHNNEVKIDMFPDLFLVVCCLNAWDVVTEHHWH